MGRLKSQFCPELRKTHFRRRPERSQSRQKSTKGQPWPALSHTIAIVRPPFSATIPQFTIHNWDAFSAPQSWHCCPRGSRSWTWPICHTRLYRCCTEDRGASLNSNELACCDCCLICRYNPSVDSSKTIRDQHFKQQSANPPPEHSLGTAPDRPDLDNIQPIRGSEKLKIELWMIFTNH